MTQLSPTPPGLSRRSALGALGAVSLAASGVLAGSGTAQAESGTDSPQPGSVPEQLRPGGAFDQLLAEQAGKDQLSGTALLAHQGEPVLVRSHGMANKRAGVPNDSDTVFALASVTKVFTAVAVTRLVQEGKVRFSDTVGTHLDGFPAETARAVTVEQLLTHTGGLGDFRRDKPLRITLSNATSESEVLDRILASIRKAPLVFTPGTDQRYSNSGYAVLGAVVAAASGRSYYDYVREHVFAAAGMTSTDFHSKPQVLENAGIARPYATLGDFDERADIVHDDHFVGSPAGDAFSTAADMARFAGALVGGELLDPASTRKLTSMVPLQFVGGGAPGKATMLATFPEKNWVAVLLLNYDRADNLRPFSELLVEAITGGRGQGPQRRVGG